MLARRLYTVAVAVALLGAAACEAEPEVGEEGEMLETRPEGVSDPAGEVVEGGPTGQARSTGPGTTPPAAGTAVDTVARP